MMGSAVRAGEPERRFYGESATVRLRFLAIRTASSLVRQESRAMLLLGVLWFSTGHRTVNTSHEVGLWLRKNGPKR